jgi:hypothetical protein
VGGKPIRYRRRQAEEGFPDHPLLSAFRSGRRPRQESNLILDLRGVACVSGTLRGRVVSAPPGSRTPSCRIEAYRAIRHTRRACFAEHPDLDSNQGLDLRRVQCYPLHHRDVSSIPTWSRTRTWTLGGSGAVRYTIGTQEPTTGLAPASSGLQNRRLAIRSRRKVRLRPEGRKRCHIYFSSSTFQYASLTNFDQLSIRTSWNA